MLTKRAPIKIAPDGDYSAFLSNLKSVFENRWKEAKTSPPVNFENFEKLQIVGTGAFGTVRLVRHTPTDKYFALKILYKSMIVKQKQIGHAINEKKILQAIEFPFVVNLEFSYKDNDCLFYGMPFINGGELFTYLRKFRKFSEIQTKFYAAQIFLGLEYLHYLSLIYRDMKPENVLMDYRGFLKITDFGFCKKIDGRTWTLCGTPEYLAPEIIQIKGYGTAIDWWTFGVLIYEMASGISPFYSSMSDDQMQLFARIVDGKYKMPKYFSIELQNLIANLLQVDVTRRYGNTRNGTADIKTHSWFRNINWTALLNQEVEPPFIPKVKNESDTTNFDRFPENKPIMSKKCQYEKEFEDF